MRLKFSDSLEHQSAAIQAVVDLFEGQPLNQTSSFDFESNTSQGMPLSEVGFCNSLMLEDKHIEQNVKKIQLSNNINEAFVPSHDYSIEMETGTGKTYVYLRTIFELSQKYGFKKFIVVVPSIAIREGVIKNIQVMKDHLNTLYDNEPFNYFVYGSQRLDRLRSFATSNTIQIMIINIQSFIKNDIKTDAPNFDKKANVIHKPNDSTCGDKPIKFIQDCQPIVIIDEPQSVDNTLKGREAITSLNPLVTLRYSATHKNPYNLLYKLDPITAYNDDLVKKIEVLSFVSEFNQFAEVKLLKLESKRTIKAYLEIFANQKNEVKRKKLWVKVGDDLFDKSNKVEAYQHGYKIISIDCSPNREYLEFNSGHKITFISAQNVNKDKIMQRQVRETIEQHLIKERALQKEDSKIKVLSLFFIDKVSNYRLYGEDNSASLGKIGKWFEEAFIELTSDKYSKFKVDNINKIHNGYFSQDSKKQIRDSRGNTKDDEDVYSLIMKDKERLLDINEPLRFIFSHSALKEGWDNPNVFQICTLNETSSYEKRRQVIGRGLRLAVNNEGERIHDKEINRLTVISNESYEQFAKNLQIEYEQEGIQFNASNIKNARDRVNVNYYESTQKSEAFKKLWDKIKYKTKYRVNLNTQQLIKDAVSLIKKINTIKPPKILMHKSALSMNSNGIKTEPLNVEKDVKELTVSRLPNILSQLQEKTKLTKDTIIKILIESGRVNEFKVNPDEFIRLVSKEISQALEEQLIKGLEYIKLNDHCWEAHKLKDHIKLESGLNQLKPYEVKNKEKSLFSYIEWDSNIERDFAGSLDNRDSVKLFIKLPRWFIINTPFGTYNPDWAFVNEKEERLCFFVAETKGSIETKDLRKREADNIECGKKHFKALDVVYDVCTDLNQCLKKYD